MRWGLLEAKTLLDEHQRIWLKKPSLRLVYQYYYDLAFSNSIPGRTLEIGAGSGSLRHCGFEVISTDIVHTSNVDVVSDAHALPFTNSSVNNIVAVDVFHHLQRPIRFLNEANRLLQPGGRLLLIEPAITILSRPFWKLFHSEPFDMNVDVLADGQLSRKRNPFDANQALGTVLATKDRKRLPNHVPGLHISKIQWTGSIAYPLSGGFRKWCFLPKIMVKPILHLESVIDKYFGRFVAFRLLLVITKD